jgi:hypothetical protein
MSLPMTTTPGRPTMSRNRSSLRRAVPAVIDAAAPLAAIAVLAAGASIVGRRAAASTPKARKRQEVDRSWSTLARPYGPVTTPKKTG